MDFYCQLDILKERGLTIEDEEDAIKFLHSVSYFRFANYLQPMELICKPCDSSKLTRFSEDSNRFVIRYKICHIQMCINKKRLARFEHC